MMPKKSGMRVLDVGAGQGYFAVKLKAAGYDVYATDFLADSFVPKDIPFEKADLNVRLPYPDGFFDYVVSIEVIEHLENQFAYAAEIMRVVRSDGRVIITTPNVLNLSSRWAQFWSGFSDCAPYPISPSRPDYFMEHINPVSLPEMFFQFGRCGAGVVRVGTNRLRKGSFVPFLILYPFLWLVLRGRLFGRAARRRLALGVAAGGGMELHQLHMRWMLTPAVLLGRIAIVEFVKR
jgi:SAM-dependent methyltransferase